VSYAPLNNATTQDRYDDARTVVAPTAVLWDIDVANAAVYYEFGEGFPDVKWRPEVFQPPGFRSLTRRADAMRVRSAVAGVPAQVTIVGLTPGEVPNLA
jgi:hypothetical protein